MAISVQCLGCGKKMKAGDQQAGKRVKCPGCGHRVAIPFQKADAPPESYVRENKREMALKMLRLDLGQIASGQHGDYFYLDASYCSFHTWHVDESDIKYQMIELAGIIDRLLLDKDMFPKELTQHVWMRSAFQLSQSTPHGRKEREEIVARIEYLADRIEVDVDRYHFNRNIPYRKKCQQAGCGMVVLGVLMLVVIFVVFVVLIRLVARTP